MTPDDYIRAARCPPSMPLGDFGLWKIERLDRDAVVPRGFGEVVDKLRYRFGPFEDVTILSRHTEATLHLTRGVTVMEDTAKELRRHLPIMRNARGRVLVTGLGLGCVVRGLLANPAVEHITVVEIDSDIIRAVWGEFRACEKLMLLQADAAAMEWPPGIRWDYAWHDLWDENKAEAELHTTLFERYYPICHYQGAWGLPRWCRRIMKGDFIENREVA